MRTSDLEYSKLKHKQFCTTEKKGKNLVKKKKQHFETLGERSLATTGCPLPVCYSLKKNKKSATDVYTHINCVCNWLVEKVGSRMNEGDFCLGVLEDWIGLLEIYKVDFELCYQYSIKNL